MARALRRLLVTLLVLVGLALAVPFVVPASSYIPELNGLLSEQLHEPAAISDLRFHVFPVPQVVATGVTIGRNQEVRIGALEIVPDIESLIYTGPVRVRLVRAANVEIHDMALTRMLARSASESSGPVPVQVQRIALTHVQFRHPELKLPVFDFVAELAEGMRLEEARLEMGLSAVRIKAAPQGRNAVLLTMQGLLYGGTVAADMRAEWGADWQVAGKASLGGVDLLPLQHLMGRPGQISGRLVAETTFSARAQSAEQLLEAMALDGSFEVKGGAYRGVDLAKAAEAGETARLESDATRFDEFKGQLKLRNRQLDVSELCMRSPDLIAGGYVAIAPDQKLSGKLGLSVAKTGGIISVPVVLSGTASDPYVAPSKGYLIGAAVGTLLLPGIGTGVGASVGGALALPSYCK